MPAWTGRSLVLRPVARYCKAAWLTSLGIGKAFQDKGRGGRVGRRFTFITLQYSGKGCRGGDI